MQFVDQAELEALSDEKLIDGLAATLERLWSGGGELGVYTVAMQRDRLRPLLGEFMRRCRGLA